MLRFAKHAKEKLSIRQIGLATIKKVRSNPEAMFYDTLRSSEVVAKRVTLNGEATTLVVIYARQDNDYFIITAYPTKRFEEEAGRKVKPRRWFAVKG